MYHFMEKMSGVGFSFNNLTCSFNNKINGGDGVGGCSGTTVVKGGQLELSQWSDMK